MFVLIGKVFLSLVQPLGLSFLLWVAAGFCFWRGWQGWGKGLAGTGIVALLGFSNPLVGEYLLGSLEDDFAALAPADCPTAEAIVVLGGMTDPPIPPRREIDVTGSFDRLLHGMRLVRAGKAPYLVLSGGEISELVGSEMTEAACLKALALEYGIDPEAILVEERSRTTHENAVYTGELLAAHGMKRILLVTSAAHMRRAVAVFHKQGMEVVPAPTDVRVVPKPFHPGKLLPSTSGLDYSSVALKEFVGVWVYRLRGWVE